MITHKETISPCMDRIVFSFGKDKTEEMAYDIAAGIGKKYPIKGYRKGKAPVDAIKTFARKIILEEMKKKLANEAYEDILYQTGYEPFGQPHINDMKVSYSHFEIDMNLAYNPEFELKKYKDFELEEPEEPDRQALIDETTMNLKKMFPVKSVFGENDFAMDGDTVVVDYKATVEGKEFPDNSASGIAIDLGAGQFIRDFEINVMGMRAGEKREFCIPFGKDFKMPALAGKSADFTVTLVNGVKNKLPELDNDFLSRFAEGSLENKLKAFTDLVSAKVEEHVVFIKNHARKQMVIDNLLKAHTIDVPVWMVEKVAPVLEKMVKRNGGVVDDYSKLMDDAKNMFMLNLILAKIKKQEKELVLSNEEVKSIITANKSRLPEDVQKNIDNPYVFARLAEELQNEQIFTWIIGHSSTKSKPVEEKPDTGEENAA